MSLGALWYGDTAAREVSQRAGGFVTSSANLQAIPPASRAEGMLIIKTDDGTLWRFVAASAAVAGNAVLVPTDAPAAGRWHKITETESSGKSTLVAGTVTIADTLVTANSKIFVSLANPLGTRTTTVMYACISRSVGVSFTIQALIAAGTIQNLDTSEVFWSIIY